MSGDQAGVLRAVLLGGFALVGMQGDASPAQDPAQSVQSVQSVQWQSTNATQGELSAEFGRLYAVLYEASLQGARVPTKEVSNATGRPLRQILEDERVFDGDYLPLAVDIFVCSLNAPICTIESDKSGRTAIGARWRNRSADPVTVPRIDFQPIIVHRLYQKRPQDKLENIVVRDRRGCVSFDDKCRLYLQNLNRRLDAPLTDAYSGEIVVPTLAYRASIPLQMRQLVSQSGTGSASSSAPHLPDVDASAVRQSVVPRARLRQQSVVATGEEGDRARVLSLIEHPFSLHQDVPSGHVVVGVLDTWLDPKHCDIKASIAGYVDSGEPMSASRVACGTRDTAIRARDHGTHVVGLIAASRAAKSGQGVNPNARIVFVRINPDDMNSPAGGYLSTVSDKLDALYPTDLPPDVVNLSFEYPIKIDGGGNDTFLRAIQAQARNTLFVASAGNGHLELGGAFGCALRPACADLPNVLTVAAIDLDANSPALEADAEQGSNYGASVHIAAPGLNIVSAIAGDRFGAMSGTSQAAPLVSGAASLLYAKNRRLEPAAVKNRLIYTSDLFPELYGKVLGGRLNVERALDFESARLATAGHPEAGGFVLIDTAKLVYFLDVDKHRPDAIAFGKIRRLKFDPGQNAFVMYSSEEGSEGTLERRLVAPTNLKATYAFQGPPDAQGRAGVQKVPLKSMLDYVSGL